VSRSSDKDVGQLNDIWRTEVEITIQSHQQNADEGVFENWNIGNKPQQETAKFTDSV